MYREIIINLMKWREMVTCDELHSYETAYKPL